MGMKGFAGYVIVALLLGGVLFGFITGKLQ